MITTQPAIRRIRGAVAGAASGISAIGAHAAAHGGLPGTRELTFLVAVCAAVGALVAAWRSPAAGRLAVLAGVLGGGQIAAHLSLAALAGGHGLMMSPHMATAHAAAAVATAVTCRALESAVVVALTALIRVIRVLLSTAVTQVSGWTLRTACDVDRRPAIAVHATSGRRGPPSAWSRPILPA
ncbi:hypothetical protein V1Y59_04525 [Gordonia sp. PKS22-38]|uniref:Integral membrane protein n=1 Tax=Gordonia prachuapensis TaxID=3115651 RepID=A0ABU7MPS4_9ACTN|nr:hypothetical protein [Gordonia sp. PKS22-38]